MPAVTRCLLLGGTGYIGSRLFLDLQGHGHHVQTVDLEWYGNPVNPANHIVDYRHLDRRLLAWADAVILLAGHSSVGMADGPLTSCFENNVVNFVRLLTTIRAGQKLIYASSASVYGDATGTSRETDVTFTGQCAYDISKHMIDILAPASGCEYYGLRFGTVCGFAPNWRSDVLINSLFLSAMTEGRVLVFDGHARRSILGLGDLCRAIRCILACRDDHRGIYNLASFATTVAETADTVAAMFDVSRRDLRPRHTGALATRYSFHLDNRRFQDTFDFVFQEDTRIILGELAQRRSELVPGDRRQRRDYFPILKARVNARAT